MELTAHDRSQLDAIDLHDAAVTAEMTGSLALALAGASGRVAWLDRWARAVDAADETGADEPPAEIRTLVETLRTAITAHQVDIVERLAANAAEVKTWQRLAWLLERADPAAWSISPHHRASGSEATTAPVARHDALTVAEITEAVAAARALIDPPDGSDE